MFLNNMPAPNPLTNFGILSKRLSDTKAIHDPIKSFQAAAGLSQRWSI